jgi:hypothetical protein
MGNKFISLISRILFILSFFLVGLSIWEKLANIMELTLMRGYYSPWHLIEFSAILLFFVIALQLREIKQSISVK